MTYTYMFAAYLDGNKNLLITLIPKASEAAEGRVRASGESTRHNAGLPKRRQK